MLRHFLELPINLVMVAHQLVYTLVSLLYLVQFLVNSSDHTQLSVACTLMIPTHVVPSTAVPTVKASLLTINRL